MKTTVEVTAPVAPAPAAPKKRRGSVRAKVKQMDWIFTWLVRTQPCAICNGSLAEGYNPRYPGKSVTLHHTEGSREEDRWEDLGYVTGMVICHSECHRSYHLKKRHAEAGKNVDSKELGKMEKNIAKAVKRQQKLGASIV